MYKRQHDPAGTYAPSIDGVVVRSSDGIHLTEAGGLWLRSRILPQVGRIGLAGRG